MVMLAFGTWWWTRVPVRTPRQARQQSDYEHVSESTPAQSGGDVLHRFPSRSPPPRGITPQARAGS
jgi:hypothetical protein